MQVNPYGSSEVNLESPGVLKRPRALSGIINTLLETPEKLKKSLPQGDKPLLRSSSDLFVFSQEIDSDEALFMEGDRLFIECQYSEAKATFLKLRNMPGWVRKRLDAINKLIEAKHPHVGKKGIQEKLANNFRYAIKQQCEERDKEFKLNEGEIPPVFTIKDRKGKQYRCSIQHEAKEINVKKVGIASTRGIRAKMEDAHLATEFSIIIGETVHRGEIFAVLDGHGGRRSVEFVRDNLVPFLKASLVKFNPKELSEEGIYQALRDCFIRLDERCDHFKDGTTAAVAMRLGELFCVANTGDGRTILSDNGIPVQMSQDAKISQGRTRQKIVKLGGKIILDKENIPRVQGIFHLGGSLGDRYVKGDKGICCMPPQPQITFYSLRAVKYIAMACDGFFDLISTRQAVDAINHLVATGETPERIAQRLVYSVLHNVYTNDNVTLIIIPIE